MKRVISGLPLFFTAATLLAQEEATATPELSDAAKTALGAGIAVVCGFWLVCIAFWLGIAIWVTKDAKRRQSPNATLVTVLAWIPATTLSG